MKIILWAVIVMIYREFHRLIELLLMPACSRLRAPPFDQQAIPPSSVELSASANDPPAFVRQLNLIHQMHR